MTASMSFKPPAPAQDAKPPFQQARRENDRSELAFVTPSRLSRPFARRSTLQPPENRIPAVCPTGSVRGARDSTGGCVLDHVVAVRGVCKARMARRVGVQRIP